MARVKELEEQVHLKDEKMKEFQAAVFLLLKLYNMIDVFLF